MAQRRALIVQHEPDGPAGLAADGLAARGFELDVLVVMQPGSPHSDVHFPDPRDYDLVLPIGSTHSVYDFDTIGSWIGREIEMLQHAVRDGVPVFGICFGAQALCAATGGRVERSPTFEIGWITVSSDEPGVVPPGPWFSWHGDRCVLPATAHEIARTRAADGSTIPQTFTIGRHAGVQFHPEVTADLVASWMRKVPPSYWQERGVEPDHLLAGFERHGDQAAAGMSRLLDWFLTEVADEA